MAEAERLGARATIKARDDQKVLPAGDVGSVNRPERCRSLRVFWSMAHIDRQHYDRLLMLVKKAQEKLVKDMSQSAIQMQRGLRQFAILQYGFGFKVHLR